jgi:hypothetical protein
MTVQLTLPLFFRGFKRIMLLVCHALQKNGDGAPDCEPKQERRSLTGGEVSFYPTKRIYQKQSVPYLPVYVR